MDINYIVLLNIYIIQIGYLNDIQSNKCQWFFGGLGNLTPKTPSIITICCPVGIDLPAYQALISCLGIWHCLPKSYWFQPLAFLACAIAILSYCEIVGAIKYNKK
jgi:hypothetical protein